MKKYIILYFSLLVMIAQGCKELTDVGVPNDKVVTANVFVNDQSAISALTSIYARMHQIGNMPYNIALLTGFYGDELKSYSSTVSLVQVYTNSVKPLNDVSPNIWAVGFNHIYQANAVYEGCEASQSLTPVVKQQLIAEAKFIRAFWHFYLLNLYGNIPVVTSTDYTANNSAHAADPTMVYKQIVSDLKDAEALLNENYVAGNSVSTSIERVRPNKMVAKALLARVYLYMKDYTNAEIKATELISSSVYQMDSFANVFLKTSKEAIWQIAVPLSNAGIGSNLEASNFILTAKPASGLTRNATLSTSLLSSFEIGDLRKANWTKEFKDMSVTPNVSYVYPFKMKVNITSSAPPEYATPLRLAEQYLIRAEARASQNKLDLAIADHDIIRKRSGLLPIAETNPTISQLNLISAIFQERRVELFTEWGHRWLDIKRNESANGIMTAAAIEKGTVWSSHKLLWPIPFSDIQNNPNLKQNPGYINQ
ncbi:RagB/SusD family nutrient uptake outer membrane protein [Pedobacter frigoris]|nr:RagB/SusD family nutrient uptake outer membrane protein [Pedobacter frigoris]